MGVNFFVVNQVQTGEITLLLRDNYGLYSNDFINMFNSGRKMITVKVNLYSILNSSQPPKKIQFAPYHCIDRVFKAF